jgi:hypothetical protein
MNILDLIFEFDNLVSVFWVKNTVLKFFDADPDPESCQPWIRDPGDSWVRINIPDPQNYSHTKYGVMSKLQGMSKLVFWIHSGFA